MPYQKDGMVIYDVEELGLGGGFFDTLVGGLDKVTKGWGATKAGIAAYQGAKTPHLTAEQEEALKAAAAKGAVPWHVRHRTLLLVGGAVAGYWFIIRPRMK